MRRQDLVPDCTSCAALCCVAPSFEASADFAIDKLAGARCAHLKKDERCGIHTELAARGFSGCVAYECHGAGQRVTRAFAADGGEVARRNRDDAFMKLRIVHELLWYATEAAKICPASRPELADDLTQQIAVLDAIDVASTVRTSETDLERERAAVRTLLRRVGEALGGRPAHGRSLVVLPGPVADAVK